MARVWRNNSVNSGMLLQIGNITSKLLEFVDRNNLCLTLFIIYIYWLFIFIFFAQWSQKQ